MRRYASPLRRRALLWLLACGPLAAPAGCEEPDDSIRGAGSIHIPEGDLRRLPAPEVADEGPPPPVATPTTPAPPAEAGPGR